MLVHETILLGMNEQYQFMAGRYDGMEGVFLAHNRDTAKWWYLSVDEERLTHSTY